MSGLAVALLSVLLLYLLWGRGIVGAAHAADPRLRRSPQVVQLMAVVFWAPNVLLAWRRERARRARLG